MLKNPRTPRSGRRDAVFGNLALLFSEAELGAELAASLSCGMPAFEGLFCAIS